MKRKILRKQYKNLCKMLVGGVAIMGGMASNQQNAQALPVEPGTPDRQNITDIVKDGGVMNITGTGNAFVRWNDFSIRPNEIVNFSGMTNMLNYVALQNPSLIYGAINAQSVNNFYLINPSGILFGPNSQVVTNNFYVSTRSLSDSDIKNYINGNDFLSGTPLINDGGLKSSDIFGAYDIADGDVMFLGKVQADSLTVEGNTIQIRNTKSMLKADGKTQLTDVNLISDNSPEVGYEITEKDIENASVNAVYKSGKYKYFIADVVGDYDMENSATKLKWKATYPNGWSRGITNYRLVETADDLQNINFSKHYGSYPYEGKIHGNYMLGNDIDLAGISFKPLGYNMTYQDYAEDYTEMYDADAYTDAIRFNGMNFTVSNLTTDNSVSSNVGLFSVFAGTVKNLRIQNATVGNDNTLNAGALAGVIGTYGGGGWYQQNEYPIGSVTIKNVGLFGTNTIKGKNAGGLIGSTGFGTAEETEGYLTDDYGEIRVDEYGNYMTGYIVTAVAGLPTVTFENIETFGEISADYNAGALSVKKSAAQIILPISLITPICAVIQAAALSVILKDLIPMTSTRSITNHRLYTSTEFQIQAR